MRHLFPGYYRFTKDEFEEMWAQAIFVPDTNILLHLLRYGEKTRNEVLRVLSALKPRIWIPYQVAFEFSRRWRQVDDINRFAHERLKGEIKSRGKSLSAVFDQVSRHQSIDAKAQKVRIEKFIDELCGSLDEALKKHPSIDDAEAIVDLIFNLVGEEVGKAPEDEVKSKRLRDGQVRYDKKIPPGYMDSNKDDVDKFGDYFIWEEMIQEAQSRKLPVIFLSDDAKDDWILREHGQTVGPRPELIQEFWKRTGQKFYYYSLTTFLSLANKFNAQEVSDQAIAEVEEDARAAEKAVIDLNEYVSGLKRDSVDQNDVLRRAVDAANSVPLSLRHTIDQNDALRRALDAANSVPLSLRHTIDQNDALRRALDAANSVPLSLRHTIDQNDALRRALDAANSLPLSVRQMIDQTEAHRMAVDRLTNLAMSKSDVSTPCAEPQSSSDISDNASSGLDDKGGRETDDDNDSG